MLDRSLTCGWMAPSLLILKAILKVTKLQMGIYHHILFIIGIKFHYFKLRYFLFFSQIFVDFIINLLLVASYYKYCFDLLLIK